MKKNHYTAVFDKLQQAFDDESSHASMYNTHTHDVDGNGENNSSRHPWSVWREGNSPILVGYMKNSCYLTAIFDDKKHPGYRTCYAAEWSDADDPDISIAQLTYVYGRKPEQQNYNLTINYDGKASWPEKKLNLLDYPVMPDNVKQSLKRLRNLPDSLFSIYSVPKDIPYDGDKNSWIGKAMNSISRLSNRDWHRFFGLLTEKMIAHANDKGSTEDMVVAAGLILDLCKNADPLDADEREISEYIHPQDNGCRTDVRWMQLKSAKNELFIAGCQPLCIRAWDYGEEDLESATHPNEIKRGSFVNLNIDLNVHGVGGVLGINKLPYHATLQLPSKWKDCREIVSLDGQWLFHWSKDPESRPVGFEREDYDVSKWDKITVPGNWQLQGYGKPIYVNMQYPFHRDRPSVTGEPPKDWYAYDHRNPVGSYVTFIDVTDEINED